MNKVKKSMVLTLKKMDEPWNIEKCVKTMSVATLMVAKFNKKYKIWKYKVDAYYILCYYDFEICICACKTGKKIWFRRSPKEKYEEHGSCLLWEIRSFRMKRSKWPFFIAKKQIRINILKGGKIKNPKERRLEELVRVKEGKW